MNRYFDLTLIMGHHFDHPENESLCKKMNQCNVSLAITRTIRGFSSKKVYKELCLETLKSRRRFRRFCCFYIIKNNVISSYLSQLTQYYNILLEKWYIQIFIFSVNETNLILIFEFPVLIFLIISELIWLRSFDVYLIQYLLFTIHY